VNRHADAPDGPAPLADARARTTFRRRLLAWYRAAARDLPWRRTREPYLILLSEVMLQQTRVETVIDHFERFRRAFPTARDLAAAREEDVLRHWAGLGYYRRARNLHAAARHIATDHAGRVPTTFESLLQLPGIGRYTAGAVASIAGGEPVPVVDGNVKRVLARLYRIAARIDDARTIERIWELADTLLARRSPGDFNQALMELGARVCTPRNPRCNECPVQQHCAAARAGLASTLPVRKRKPAVPRITLAAAAIIDRHRLLLVQRPAGGLLGGMWTLPAIETASPHDLTAAIRAGLDLEIELGAALGTVTHIFTHRRWQVHVWSARRVAGRLRATSWPAARWIPTAQAETRAHARIDRKLIALAAQSHE
jgi:A/G-specific adenine glycosylase